MPSKQNAGITLSELHAVWTTLIVNTCKVLPYTKIKYSLIYRACSWGKIIAGFMVIVQESVLNNYRIIALKLPHLNLLALIISVKRLDVAGAGQYYYILHSVKKEYVQYIRRWFSFTFVL